MDYGVIDCHAHIFPPAATAAGFADAATHLLHQQRAMHVHGNQPYRHQKDGSLMRERPIRKKLTSLGSYGDGSAGDEG